MAYPNGETQLNMVIGNPIKHSHSPLLHNWLYRQLKLNAVLLPFRHHSIEPLVAAIKNLNVGLTAVTLPFKLPIMEYLDDCSEEAQAIQAVNTVVQRDGKLHGYNTDIDGIAYAMKNILLIDKHVLIIGAGGAAQAAGYFLKQRDTKQLYWLNRTTSRAQKLADQFGGEVVAHNQLEGMRIDIIINTTPVGMWPNKAFSPLPNYPFDSRQYVFDMIYNPLETQLMKQGRRQRAVVISGLQMFIGQAVRQIELWSGEKLDEKEVAENFKQLLTLETDIKQE